MTPPRSPHPGSLAKFQRMPPELVDHIIAFLEDSSLALKSCTLVSHAWLATARRLLFKELSIVVWKDAGDVFTFVSQLTASPSHGLGRYVRHLSLDDMPLTKRFVRDRFPMNGQTMFAILELLPNLKVLELKSLIYSPFPSDIALHPLLQPTTATSTLEKQYHLDRLVIHVVGVQNPDDAVACLLDSLSVLSSIDELEILPHVEESRSGACFGDGPRPPSNVFPRMPTIRKLFACFPYLTNGMLQGVVVEALASTRLETLTLRACATDEHFRAVGVIVEGSKETLRNLEFEFCSWQMLRTLQDARRDWSTLNLSACTSLRTLTIHRLVKNPTSSGAPIDTSLHTLLALTPATLRTLHIRAFASTALQASSDGDTAKSLVEWDWAGLKKEVGRLVREGALEEIVFVSWGEVMGEDSQEVVRAGLGAELVGKVRFEMSEQKDW
ncbi:hypothetical protein EIP91_008695 [Steccherinum ochraceum]|uniref:F-box domain-containing protein n=1 Tax=Steccherinum ochraceum TaxID=92696 RepID=A0A4R0R2H2_9APHY|nr:hypothetical protein EIP91_008695 [Steccherinum ochraceum]